MALYAIGDLHLSLAVDKSMEIFGPAWENYISRIEEGLSLLRPEDTLVLAGDTSWGMTLAEAEEYIQQGQFAPGSMLPKVQSCMEFVEHSANGGTALITSLARAAEALDGKTGTVVEK